MNAGASPSREIPIDVLPPVPSDAPHPVTGTVTRGGLGTFYHPASGVVILGIDLVAFAPEMLSGFLDTPILCVLSFLVTFPLVFLIQWKWGGDRMPSAFGKALLGAFMAGLPFSIAGTIYGAAILGLSGLPHHPLEAVKRLVTGQGVVRK